MKKILAIILLLCVTVLSLASCSENNSAKETSYTVDCVLKIPPRFYSADELYAAISRSDLALPESVREMRKLYYPEIVIEGYAIGVIEVFDYSIQYHIVPEEFKDNWLEAPAGSKSILTVSFTSHQTVAELEKFLTGLNQGKITVLDESTVLRQAAYAREVYFIFDGIVCSVSLHDSYYGQITAQSIVKMHYRNIPVTK